MTFRTAARNALTVYRKEVLDALRDRRTLAVVFLSSVLLGPLVLVALSSFIASFEARADKRELMAVGLEQAPSLRNYIERQSVTIKPAPRDIETRLRDGRLAEPVLVVPEGFERSLLQGEVPSVEVVSDSSDKQAQADAARIERLVEGFARERVTLDLAMRGVSPQVLQPLQVQERDLANAQARAMQLTGLLPFFVLMAVLYGALHGALDTTAGERERGSLEPLLMNPSRRLALVLGKWAAVASVAMLIAVLSCVSFLPAQALLRSDTLQAMFRFGPREAALFVLVLLPFAAMLSALLMAVAIRCRSVKEAQASCAALILALSLLPLLTLLGPSRQAGWQWWVPGVAQNALMSRVLKGEAMGAAEMLWPLLVCAVLTAAGVAFVTRSLRTAALA